VIEEKKVGKGEGEKGGDFLTLSLLLPIRRVGEKEKGKREGKGKHDFLP